VRRIHTNGNLLDQLTEHSRYTHAFKDSHRIPLMSIVAEKVRSDQSCHTGANYSYLLLCFALCEGHLDGALQIPIEKKFAEKWQVFQFQW
jgi:hypothetical protein